MTALRQNEASRYVPDPFKHTVSTGFRFGCSMYAEIRMATRPEKRLKKDTEQERKVESEALSCKLFARNDTSVDNGKRRIDGSGASFIISQNKSNSRISKVFESWR